MRSVCDLLYEEVPSVSRRSASRGTALSVGDLLGEEWFGQLFLLSHGPSMQSQTPRFGLVWCTGQAWIHILDLVRNQLEHTIDLSLLCRRPYGG